MTKLNITTGRYEVNPNDKAFVSLIESDGTYNHNELLAKTEDKGVLISDAFNTYQSTGKLPSELAKENEELKSSFNHISNIDNLACDPKMNESEKLYQIRHYINRISKP